MYSKPSPISTYIHTYVIHTTSESAKKVRLPEELISPLWKISRYITLYECMYVYIMYVWYVCIYIYMYTYLRYICVDKELRGKAEVGS